MGKSMEREMRGGLWRNGRRKTNGQRRVKRWTKGKGGAKRRGREK